MSQRLALPQNTYETCEVLETNSTNIEKVCVWWYLLFLEVFPFFSFLFVTFLSRCFICLFQGWLWNLRVRSKCIKKLTSIGMSNLKVVCWTNTYRLLLCSCLAWRQIALCESLLNLHFQRVPIHNCHLLLTSLAQITCTFCPSLSGDELMIVKR